MKISAFETGIEARKEVGVVALTMYLASFAAILFVGADTLAAEAGAGSAPALAVGRPAEPTADAASNAPAEASSTNGLIFKFHSAPLELVLNYLSSSAGFVIHPEVSLNGRVDVWSDRPLSPDEAIKLLENVLSEQGYAVTRDGRLLTIFAASEATRRNTPVVM